MQVLSRTPITILKAIKEKILDAKDLSKHQRKVCIRHFILNQPELAHIQIAHILGTTSSTVSRYVQKIAEEDKWFVQKLDPQAWAARLIRNADISMIKLRQSGKWFLAHRVEMELTDKLINLGILPKAPTPIDLNLSGEAKITLQEIVKRAVGTRQDEGETAALGRFGEGLARISPN